MLPNCVMLHKFTLRLYSSAAGTGLVDLRRSDPVYIYSRGRRVHTHTPSHHPTVVVGSRRGTLGPCWMKSRVGESQLKGWGSSRPKVVEQTYTTAAVRRPATCEPLGDERIPVQVTTRGESDTSFLYVCRRRERVQESTLPWDSCGNDD